MRWTRKQHTFTLPGWAWAIIGFAALASISGLFVALLMTIAG